MFSKSEYDKLYTKENYQTVTIRLSKEQDKDIIDHLDRIKKIGGCSKQSYIKELIRMKLKH